MNRILQGDNLEALRQMPSGSVALIYVDPPFNTGRRQMRLRMKTVRDEAGDRTGFGGRRYRTELVKAENVRVGAGEVAEEMGDMRTGSTISWGFCGHAWWRLTVCWRRREACFCTSTIARCTTAK